MGIVQVLVISYLGMGFDILAQDFSYEKPSWNTVIFDSKACLWMQPFLIAAAFEFGGFLWYMWWSKQKKLYLYDIESSDLVLDENRLDWHQN